MQNRLNHIFARCRQEQRRALVVFASCGCPDPETGEALIDTIIRHGADIVELGVPFSDPMADGPVIQQASRLAIDNGTTLAGILAMAGRLRQSHPRTGLVLFSYYNLILNHGPEKLVAEAARQGIDAILCVDLPFEERHELKPLCDRHGVALIPLLSPATPPERAARIMADASGFAYYVTVRGVTGERNALPADLAERLDALRQLAPLPIAAGFGIASAATARQVAPHADAVVVGSAIVKLALSGGNPKTITAATAALVGELAAAVRL